VVKAPNLPTAYYPFEIDSPVIGSMYWDLTLNFAQIYTAAGWIPLVGGTIGGPGSNFIDGEVVFGSGTQWSLSRIPVPAGSLQLFQSLPSFGNILLRNGIDYNTFGQAIVTINSIAAGSLIAWYRY
jgi:hypothetical protein